jgi:hypothetical protein
MKASGQKLKKLKTRQVYGFKKEVNSMAGIWETTTVTSSQIMVCAAN